MRKHDNNFWLNQTKSPGEGKTNNSGEVRFAFTLAEVLITLGVIGIVAAMTIPLLLNNYQEKRTISQFKETYSIIAQALRMAQQDEYGTPEEWGLSLSNVEESNAKIVQILKQYIKIALDCGQDDTNGQCIKNTNYKYLNGADYYNFAQNTSFHKIVLLNSTAMFIRFQQNSDFKQIDFFIDTNGKNSPNVVGRDLFAFTYRFDQGFFIDGAPGDDTPYERFCKLSSSGWGCAYYIVTFENMNYLHKK